MPAPTLLTTVPNFISLEQHQAVVASTPESFADIPPVLKHQENDVKVSFDPPLAEFSDQDREQGTLYVLTSALTFFSSTGKGFQVNYRSITLHAVSRGEVGPAIYCQLEDEPSGAAGGGADDGGDEVDAEMRELWIIPQNSDALESIFEALSQCAALHPDPDDGEDDLDDAFISESADPSAFETFTGDENEELSEAGKAALAHLESIIYDPHKLQPEEGEDEGNDPDAEGDIDEELQAENEAAAAAAAAASKIEPK